MAQVGQIAQNRALSARSRTAPRMEEHSRRPAAMPSVGALTGGGAGLQSDPLDGWDMP